MITVYDFKAEWCGPCKVQEPIFHEVEEHFAGNDTVEFNTIDVDENQNMANKYNVRGIPAIVIEKDGTIQEKLVGVTQKDDLINAINNAR